MVSFDQVYFGKDGGSSKIGGEILNMWYWVPVGDCCVVQTSVISAWAPTPRNFWHHVERWHPWAGWSAYDSHRLHSLELRFSCCQLVWREATSSGVNRRAWCGNKMLHTMFALRLDEVGCCDVREVCKQLVISIDRARLGIKMRHRVSRNGQLQRYGVICCCIHQLFSRREFERKKSAPSRGRDTSATVNSQVYMLAAR